MHRNQAGHHLAAAFAAGIIAFSGSRALADEAPARPTALEDALALLASSGFDDACPAEQAEARESERKDFGHDPRFAGFTRPVTNVVFHHPFIRNELRPLFVNHWFPQKSVLAGGSLRLYALQANFALSDRFLLTAYKDGYADFDSGAFPHDRGFADIAFGLKAQVWRDESAPAVLAVGLGFETKTGDREVLEGRGASFFDLFASYARPIGPFDVIVTGGLHEPRDRDEDVRAVHWHVHVDLPLHDESGARLPLTPLVELNGFHYASNAERNAGLGPTVPLDFEGFDYTTLGSGDVKGNDVMTAGFGFRWQFDADVSMGLALEVPLGQREDINRRRLTIDLVYEF